MSSPAISYLALDASYDPDFNPQNALTGTQAVAQDILTRLRLWYGEWWENLKLGLPVLQVILGQQASAQAQSAMALAIQTQIQQTPYVVSVLSVQTQYKSGQFSFTAQVQTQFGLVNVGGQLGQNANMGGG